MFASFDGIEIPYEDRRKYSEPLFSNLMDGDMIDMIEANQSDFILLSIEEC